jgi:hypothetical protein
VCPLCSASVNRINSDLFPLDIFNIQIGEMAFCKPDFIRSIIKTNYFQKSDAQKGEKLLDDFEALVREMYVPG